MLDYAESRQQMVDAQIRTSGVTDYDLLDAFSTIPREMFIPESMQALAYSDADIVLSPDRAMFKPSILGRLLQLAEIKKDDLVLIVAANTGYSAALASRLGNTIVALESNETLVEKAEKTLSELGYDNIAFISGDLKQGVSSQGPYDIIFIDGKVIDIPEDLLNQLKEGGRLVTVKQTNNCTEAVLIKRNEDEGFTTSTAFDANSTLLSEFS